MSSYRKPLKRGKSMRLFSSTAQRVHKKNYAPIVDRGGGRM
jgi:hypothetical protein